MFACLPRSAWVFSMSPTFFPHPKDEHVRWVGMTQFSQSEWVRVWCALQWKCVLSRSGSCLAPWAARPGSCTLWTWTRISGLEKSLSWFYSSSLNVCITHLFQCLILEMFWAFIYKLGDVFVTRNRHELNSYWYQLSYGKMGYEYIVSLKVAVSKNLLTTLSEDLLYLLPYN